MNVIFDICHSEVSYRIGGRLAGERVNMDVCITKSEYLFWIKSIFYQQKCVVEIPFLHPKIKFFLRNTHKKLEYYFMYTKSGASCVCVCAFMCVCVSGAGSLEKHATHNMHIYIWYIYVIHIYVYSRKRQSCACMYDRYMSIDISQYMYVDTHISIAICQ